MLKDRVDRLVYLDELVRKRKTGTPQELSKKLNLSLSGWYKLRDALVNDLEVPLEYDTSEKTYFYTQRVKFVIGLQPLGEDRKAEVSGGNYFFSKNFAHSTFSRVGSDNFVLNLQWCRDF